LPVAANAKPAQANVALVAAAVWMNRRRLNSPRRRSPQHRQEAA